MHFTYLLLDRLVRFMYIYAVVVVVWQYSCGGAYAISYLSL